MKFSSKRKAKFCTQGGITPGTPYMYEKVALQRRVWGSWWTPSWTWVSTVPLQHRPTASRAPLGKTLPASQGRWSSLLNSGGGVVMHCVHLVCCVQFWASQYEKLKIQNPTGYSPGQPSLLDPAWVGGFGLDNLQGFLPTLTILWVCAILFSNCRAGWYLFWAETSNWRLLKLNLNEDSIRYYAPDNA